jgi:hypothetical protein
MTSRRRTALSVIGGMALVAVLATPSVAHRDYRTDPNDVVGKTDIRGVLYNHHDGRTFLKVMTYHKLRREHLNGGNYLWEQLDTRGGNAADFFIYFEWRSQVAEYFGFIYDGMNFVRRVPADKSERAIKVDFPNSRVDGLAERFAAGAYFGQFDYAPNKGQYVHWGGGDY